MTIYEVSDLVFWSYVGRLTALAGGGRSEVQVSTEHGARMALTIESPLYMRQDVKVVDLTPHTTEKPPIVL